MFDYWYRFKGYFVIKSAGILEFLIESTQIQVWGKACVTAGLKETLTISETSGLMTRENQPSDTLTSHNPAVDQQCGMVELTYESDL